MSPGGGICVVDGYCMLVVENTLENNEASTDGGGVYVKGGESSSVERNRILQNTAHDGTRSFLFCH